jgi:branched-chain amino acid transport system ATP-binding protein
MTPILQATGLSISFGGIRAVSDISLDVRKGELLGLIGANGAGKTTFLRLLTGILKPHSGKVMLDGVDITSRSVDRRARSGLAVTHQIVRPFRGMSVIDNVMLAGGHRLTGSPARAFLRYDRSSTRTAALGLLDRVGLADVAERIAGTLPLGQLKRLEVVRALGLEPKLLMLDEPLAGLNHAEAAQLTDVIAALNRDGMTIVLVEHRLAEVLRVADRLAVLDKGQMLAAGIPSEIMQRSDVQASYLGQDARASS